MTLDRPRPKRRRNHPVMVYRLHTEPTADRPAAPGRPWAWHDSWFWQCTHEDCDIEVTPTYSVTKAGSQGVVEGADGWAEALRLGLKHLATTHPDYRPRPPEFTLFVVSHDRDLDGFWPDGKIPWCGQLGALPWDCIVVDRPPATDAEREWLERLATRLRPGGDMWWWTYIDDVYTSVPYIPGQAGAAA